MINAASWKRLVEPLLGDGWRVRGTLAYLGPVEWTLHGILGESSQSSGRFYLWVVNLPILAPTDGIDLSWSERYGGGTRTYDAADEATGIALAGARGWAEREAASSQLVPDLPGGAINVLMQETRAYGLFLGGNPGRALEVLGRVVRYEAEYAWEHAFVDRAAGMRDLISAGRHQEASDRLASWRLESLSTLGIDAAPIA